ncbi:uncharacterized protein LOC116187855 isoform X2 [Punica granatum]|uniref:Uncharacterized protein LOC116187855 isoform X2 n=1 Tax=Punica granatum TaxID=22663 RepID=A0A6P8BTA2_PUNGR|nr:uncharacterized protein LOC116187855 isoform X2 [Punica granatum]
MGDKRQRKENCRMRYRSFLALSLGMSRAGAIKGRALTSMAGPMGPNSKPGKQACHSPNDRLHFLQVFAFGSVPLRTYLPDGDIDVTVLCHQNLVEDLIRGLCSMVEERGSINGEFKMKDVQIIHAQVKIVKLNVKNIAVDVSFNQIAGLGALCFLEQVDRLIGKEHLFKRSVLLVKAWCFYEGRILGSQNGLISTYGLEIMVLCIINLFHASVSGPLGVLCKFLDYFSKFNWQRRCISIYGPIAIESLPGLVVDSTDINVDQLLLGKDFLRSCKELFSVPDPDDRTKRFPVKHLNIVDPLKENNNLGRSVSKGNAMRIKCAFAYGARTLGTILMLPIEQMVRELETFFLNTLNRNGRGVRLDVDAPVPVFGTGKFERFSLNGELDSYYNDFLHGQQRQEHALSSDQPPSLPSLALTAPALAPPSPRNQNDGRWSPSSRLQFQSRATPSSWRGADAFVPRPHLQHPQSPRAASYIEFGRSRGTGTYIPVTARRPPKRTQIWSRAGNSGSSRKLSTMEAEAIEAPKKEEGEGSGCFDLSPEQFPLLSSLKKTDAVVEARTNQSEVVPPKAGEPSICFGSFQSSVGQSSSVTAKKVVSCQNAGEVLMSSSSSEKGKEPRSLESADESTSAKPFQLEDEGEFPPLAQ